MKKLLIIEDDKGISGILKIIFKHTGFSVDQAYDGKQALLLVHENNYDAITLDLTMPNVNGWQFLKMTEQEIHKKTYVFSGFVDERISGYVLGGFCEKSVIATGSMIEKIKLIAGVI